MRAVADTRIVNADLCRATAALDAGRREETLIHLWSALESASADELREVLALARHLGDARLVQALEQRGVEGPPAAARPPTHGRWSRVTRTGGDRGRRRSGRRARRLTP